MVNKISVKQQRLLNTKYFCFNVFLGPYTANFMKAKLNVGSAWMFHPIFSNKKYITTSCAGMKGMKCNTQGNFLCVNLELDVLLPQELFAVIKHKLKLDAAVQCIWE